VPFPYLFGRRRSRPRTARPAAPKAQLQIESLESRLVPYALSGNAWPHPNLITISFVPDGTNLGGAASNLFATFNAKFGSASTWQNQILKAAQTWAQATNVNFAIVADDGAGAGAGNYQQGDPAMGDIRIGGYNFGDNALAQAFMPPPANNYSLAGDIQFNTGATFNIGQTYDLYTVAVHEFGHALGMEHSNVISAAMYSAYGGVKSGLTCDDSAGIQAIYGGARTPDRYEATGTGDSFSTAVNLTPQINSLTQTALVTDLGITTNSDVNYYTVTAPSGTTGSFTVQIQSAGLSLLAPKVLVYAANQSTVLGAVSGAGKYGTTLSVTVKNVTAGQSFYVKVQGADTSPFGTGAYALTLNFGSGASPTVPLPDTQTPNGTPLSGGGGQAVRVFQETLVNTTTNDNQQTFPQSPKAVATDANGNYVVTWSSHNQDGGGWGIYAQRYSASGLPIGGEFRVNTTTQDDQMYSTVAMDPTGDFVITWSSHNQDGNGWGVYAQRYNASGVPVGAEFRVNSYTASDQMYSNVAMDSLGDFVITWSSNGQDGNGWGVYAQEYSNLGLPIGGEFRVNTYTQDNQMYSTVAMDAAGDFVITWSSHNQDGNGWGIYAQRYAAGGLPVGGEFRVNTTTQDDQEYSTVAMDAVGNFVITWASHNQDGNGWGIYAQQYSALGVPLGTEFRVNSTTQNDQEYSSIAMAPNGNFVVTWSSNNQDGNGWGVYGAQFLATGAPESDEFQVNSTTQGNQMYSSIAMDGNGHVVIVWSGNGVGDNNGVFAQQYLTYSLTPGGGPNLLLAGDQFNPAGDDTGDGLPETALHAAEAAARMARHEAVTVAKTVLATAAPLQLTGHGQPTITLPAPSATRGLFVGEMSGPTANGFLPRCSSSATQEVTTASLAAVLPATGDASVASVRGLPSCGTSELEGKAEQAWVAEAPASSGSSPLPQSETREDQLTAPEAIAWPQACDAYFGEPPLAQEAVALSPPPAEAPKSEGEAWQTIAVAVLAAAVIGGDQPRPRQRTQRPCQVR
jgi:hypothetical protein